MITCACGRVADHKYKEGIIFSNSLILGKLATFLHKNDIFSLKLAFSNYHLIEVYLHELSCKEHKWGIRCDCSHRSLIVTIWPQKYPKKYKKIQKIHPKIQKNPKKYKILQKEIQNYNLPTVGVSWTNFYRMSSFSSTSAIQSLILSLQCNSYSLNLQGKIVMCWEKSSKEHIKDIRTDKPNNDAH